MQVIDGNGGVFGFGVFGSFFKPFNKSVIFINAISVIFFLFGDDRFDIHLSQCTIWGLGLGDQFISGNFFGFVRLTFVIDLIVLLIGAVIDDFITIIIHIAC